MEYKINKVGQRTGKITQYLFINHKTIFSVSYFIVQIYFFRAMLNKYWFNNNKILHFDIPKIFIQIFWKVAWIVKNKFIIFAFTLHCTARRSNLVTQFLVWITNTIYHASKWKYSLEWALELFLSEKMDLISQGFLLRVIELILNSGNVEELRFLFRLKFFI